PRYADNSKQVVIDQPCLSIYGTTTGTVLWQHVDEVHLEGGFFSRLAVFPDVQYVDYTEPTRNCELPESIIEAVSAWVSRKAGIGNLSEQSPTPIIVPHVGEARERYVQ